MNRITPSDLVDLINQPLKGEATFSARIDMYKAQECRTVFLSHSGEMALSFSEGKYALTSHSGEIYFNVRKGEKAVLQSSKSNNPEIYIPTELTSESGIVLSKLENIRY